MIALINPFRWDLEKIMNEDVVIVLLMSSNFMFAMTAQEISSQSLFSVLIKQFFETTEIVLSIPEFLVLVTSTAIDGTATDTEYIKSSQIASTRAL